MSPTAIAGRLLLMPEVAERTRMSVKTLRYLRHIGEGPPSFRLHRRVVYPEAELERWLVAQARKEPRRGGGDAPAA